MAKSTQKDVYDNLLAIDPNYISYDVFQEKMKNPKHVETIREYLKSENVPVSDSARFFEKYSTPIVKEQTQSPLSNYPKNDPVTPKPTKLDQIREFVRPGVEAAFPRLTQRTTGEITPSEVGKDMLRGSLDALSFIPRSAIAASQTAGETLGELLLNRNPSAIKNVPSKFVENLGVIETPKGTGVMGVVEDVARGPFIAAPGVGSFVPKTASLLPKIAAGVGDIALGAGLGTAESVAANEGVNPLGAGIGGALGALSPIGRGFKGGADLLSDRAFSNKFVSEMQEKALVGNADAQLFLNEFAQRPIPETVREKVGNKLASADIFDEPFKVGKRAYNEARKLADSQGIPRQEADVIARKAEDEAIKLFQKARQADVFSPTPSPISTLSLDPNKTIKQASSKFLGYEAPNIPRSLTNDPVVRNAIKSSSDITGLPSGLAWLSFFSGIGSPYFAYEAIKKNPHALADATSFVPRQTGTVIRNLGATLLDGPTQESRRYNQR